MPKKTPMRQCLGCREMKAKQEMFRVVRGPEGSITLDSRGKSPGRGAYICPRQDCFARARKSRALERALDTAIPAEVYEELARRLEEEASGNG